MGRWRVRAGGFFPFRPASPVLCPKKRSYANVTIFTDGSCLGNPGRGGWGCILRCEGHEKELSGGYAHTTNNRMEIMAAIAGLEELKEPCAVTLYTDSQYLRHAVEKKWLAGGGEKGGGGGDFFAPCSELLVHGADAVGANVLAFVLMMSFALSQKMQAG